MLALKLAFFSTFSQLQILLIIMHWVHMQKFCTIYGVGFNMPLNQRLG